jgi:hypothetical protein
MGTLEDIFSLRQPLGFQKQPSFRLDLEECEKILEVLEAGHPYELSLGKYIQLMSRPQFSGGPRGTVAGLPNKDYLYRLTYASQLLHDEGVNWKYSFGQQRDTQKAWGKFNEDSRKSEVGGWVSLSRYASGHLRGYRQFTWWTSEERVSKNPAATARKLGLLEIGKRGVVLRVKMEKIAAQKIAHVPSCLDGFPSLVFLPMSEGDNSGSTIDISDVGSICEGVDEYTLGPIQVNDLEFLPVTIARPEHLKNKLTVDDKFLVAILGFYMAACS